MIGSGFPSALQLSVTGSFFATRISLGCSVILGERYCAESRRRRKESYDLDVCTNFKQSLRRVQVNLLHVLLRPVLCHNLHMPEFLSRLATSKNKTETYVPFLREAAVVFSAISEVMTIRFAFQKHVPRIQTFVSPLFSADTLDDNTSSLERTNGRLTVYERTLHSADNLSMIAMYFAYFRCLWTAKMRTDIEKVETIAVSWRQQNRAKEEVSLINFYFLSYQRSKSVCMCYVGSWKRRPISRLTKSRETRKDKKIKKKTFENRGLVSLVGLKYLKY